MKQRFTICLAGLISALFTPHAQAVLSRLAVDEVRQLNTSDAVLRGVVIGKESFRDDRGRIETRVSVQVEEALKGRFPAVISFTMPGGTLGGESTAQGCQPHPKPGEERIFFLSQGHDGGLKLNNGAAGAPMVQKWANDLSELRMLAATSIDPIQDFSDQAMPASSVAITAEASSSGTTNLFTDGTYGLPGRFLGPDRGRPIPYLVDADTLPAGMTLETALAAVQNALASWTEVAFLDFRFEGITSFGMSAVDVTSPVERLHIQLHNSYGEITSPNTLGVGGRSASLSVLGNGWTTGGRVFLNDFHNTSAGYVVLNHTSTSTQNATTFEEVLCHEIGHALGMMHSSEDINEPTSSPAYQAIMYYLVHADGRGAAPQGWDINVIQQSHPTNNSPPYSFDRMMDVITASPTPSIPGVNQILLTGDLQSTLLSTELFSASLPGNGTFSVSSNLLSYTPANFWSDTARFDPTGNSSLGSVYYRLSDGMHASPWARVRVLSYSQDTWPSGAIDGIPDNWMIANFFGNPNPAAGPNRGANDDYDGDNLTNMEEYRSWMDPKLASSAQRVTASKDGTVSWQGESYELYELQSSTNLTDWSFEQAVLATNNSPSIPAGSNLSGLKAYRILKVP